MPSQISRRPTKAASDQGLHRLLFFSTKPFGAKLLLKYGLLHIHTTTSTINSPWGLSQQPLQFQIRRRLTEMASDQGLHRLLLFTTIQFGEMFIVRYQMKQIQTAKFTINSPWHWQQQPLFDPDQPPSPLGGVSSGNHGLLFFTAIPFGEILLVNYRILHMKQSVYNQQPLWHMSATV